MTISPNSSSLVWLDFTKAELVIDVYQDAVSDFNGAL